ncbi:MAG: tetratricopeptide repeat protein [Tidjanibacter sp.]|nr:tetratricopeptide repeat protein [Tidjanibacter sp.]
MRKFLLTLILALGLFVNEAHSQYNKQFFYYVGREYLIDNRYREAIETLNVLLRFDPKAYEAYFLRGIAKYNLDDLLGAEADFTSAIALNPVYTTAYQYRAITRATLGNYDDALNDFAEAIDLRPDIAGPYYSRGVTYLQSQQFEKAIADFDMYIRFENLVADAYINRGTAYLYLQDTLKAHEDFDRAVRTNREYPVSYAARGSLLMNERRYEEALADFNMAIRYDSTYIIPYFNRALTYNNLNRPMEAMADFDKVIELDPHSAIAYFNRAILRTNIGDYNRALDDYNKVTEYLTGNVLVYYNRAGLYTILGDYESSLADYNRAIELYPDFANAYINRSGIKTMLRDERGAREDRMTAERKIAEYRSKLTDSTFSIYADTSRKFNALLAFDTKFSGSSFERASDEGDNVTLRPMFRFTIRNAEVQNLDPQRYRPEQAEAFLAEMAPFGLQLTTESTDLAADSLIVLDRSLAEEFDWQTLFKRGITQTLIRQYTSSVNLYTAAIEVNPTNPFLYFNRATTRAEMIEFISSIDNSYQRVAIESDPVARLHNSSRSYNYDEAIADLNKAAKLYPEWAHIYYNRACLYALSGDFPAAYEDYTRAIELNPTFAEAYFNRGLVQIYMKDTRKGCLDVSKAGELGILDAYAVLRRYSIDEE